MRVFCDEPYAGESAVKLDPEYINLHYGGLPGPGKFVHIQPLFLAIGLLPLGSSAMRFISSSTAVSVASLTLPISRASHHRCRNPSSALFADGTADGRVSDPWNRG